MASKVAHRPCGWLSRASSGWPVRRLPPRHGAVDRARTAPISSAHPSRPPEQNGRHERQHLTLKKATTKPAGGNVLQQQARFDAFVDEYNQERPHQALEMKVPADVYDRSPRVCRGLEDLSYPFHDTTMTVTSCGRICFNERKVNLSHALAGQNVGVTQVGDRIWLVTFMQYDLGYFDHETCRLEPVQNPFGSKVLPMSPE